MSDARQTYIVTVYHDDLMPNGQEWTLEHVDAENALAHVKTQLQHHWKTLAGFTYTVARVVFVEKDGSTHYFGC